MAATLLWMGVAMVTSCSSSEKGSFASFGAEGWAYSDTVSVTPVDPASVDPVDPVSVVPVDTEGLTVDTQRVAKANVAVAIRHTNDYPYSNIWVETTYHDGDTLLRDSFDIRLADVYGHWYGKGVGVSFQQVDTVLKGIDIDLTKPITLRHIMRADTLYGIQQAGLIVIQ